MYKAMWVTQTRSRDPMSKHLNLFSCNEFRITPTVRAKFFTVDDGLPALRTLSHVVLRTACRACVPRQATSATKGLACGPQDTATTCPGRARSICASMSWIPAGPAWTERNVRTVTRCDHLFGRLGSAARTAAVYIYKLIYD